MALYALLNRLAAVACIGVGMERGFILLPIFPIYGIVRAAYFKVVLLRRISGKSGYADTCQNCKAKKNGNNPFNFSFHLYFSLL